MGFLSLPINLSLMHRALNPDTGSGWTQTRTNHALTIPISSPICPLTSSSCSSSSFFLPHILMNLLPHSQGTWSKGSCCIEPGYQSSSCKTVRGSDGAGRLQGMYRIPVSPIHSTLNTALFIRNMVDNSRKPKAATLVSWKWSKLEPTY